MTRPATRAEPTTLLEGIRWFIRLRWLAGVSLLLAALLGVSGHETPTTTWLGALGWIVLAYNAAFWLAFRARSTRADEPRVQLAAAHLQILLDLIGLTLGCLWSGGLASPLVGLFVLHMVFASLLLPAVSAYASGLAAIVAFLLGLSLTGQWPATSAGIHALAGWITMVLLTVYLASHITEGLRHRDRALRRQQAMLAQNEKMSAMGRLAAGVAHEIANPLASLDSVIQLGRSRGGSFDDETVAVLRTQIGRIDRIVRQLTDFAHPGDQEEETLPLNRIVEQSLEMIRLDRRARRVELEHDLMPDPPDVRVNALAVQQVVVNIVMNAMDAAADLAEPRLEIRTRVDGQWAVIDVADNGPGVPPEHLGHVFEPFFTTKPVGEGTGLGLSISYGLMERHGGRIEVRNGPDGGAIFSALLPLSRSGEGGGDPVPDSENPVS